MTQETNILTFSLQAYHVPKIVEDKNRDYVYWGANNGYPQYLLDLYNESSTHGAIVDSKVKYITGRGLGVEEDAVRPASVEAFLESANEYESWNDLLERIALDDQLFNGFAIKCRRKGGKIYYYHVPFSEIRRSKSESDLYYISDNWVKWDSSYQSLEYCRYDDADSIRGWKRNWRPSYNKIRMWRWEDKDQKEGLIYVRRYNPSLQYYPMPEYQRCIAAIETDVRIADYNLNEITNGFVGGYHINLAEGKPHKEKQEDFERRLTKKFTSNENANRVFITFSNGAENAPQLTALNGNDLAERYLNAEKAVQQNIFIGHQITSPLLFGVKTEGQLGGTTELADAYEIFNNKYAKHRRKYEIDIINWIAEMDRGVTGITMVEEPPAVSKPEIDFKLMWEAMTDEEKRQYITDETGMEFRKYSKFHKFSEEEENPAQFFENCGVPASDYTVMHSFDMIWDDEGMPKDFAFAHQLTEDEVKVLAAVQENPNLTRTEIAEAVNLDLDEVAEIYHRLMLDGFLRKQVTTLGVLWVATPTGERTLKTVDSPPELKIMYQYTLRDDAPPLKGDKSRPFCERMMSLNRLYSRAEIDLLRNEMKRSGFADVDDVWLARGGWYRRPGSEVSVPFCRHIWKQVVVKKNG